MTNSELALRIALIALIREVVMEKTDWMSCRTTPPVRDGDYEVILWGPGTNKKKGHFSAVMMYSYLGNEWLHPNHIELYEEYEEYRPGWHKKDKWRGMKK